MASHPQGPPEGVNGTEFEPYQQQQVPSPDGDTGSWGGVVQGWGWEALDTGQ